MTEEIEPTEPQTGVTDPKAGKLAAEAAKYRKRAQDAEAALSAAQEHISALQGEVVRRIVGERLLDADDFDTHLEKIGRDTVLGDDGRLDPEKVEAQLGSLIEAKPYLAPSGPSVRQRPRPADGASAGEPPAPKQRNGDWITRAFGERGVSSTNWRDIVGRQNLEGHVRTVPDDRSIGVKIDATDTGTD